MGLTDFNSLLIGDMTAPVGYAETHSIDRSETNTVTVDQAGTGSAGTFTVTVDATSESTDTASGNVANSSALTASGTGTLESTSHYVISGTYHVVDNEPGTPASGTELFHRDETFSHVNDVTGSGSYVGGSANADYHAVDIGSFAVANVSTSNDDFSTGYDDDGEAYSLLFNYSNTTNGSGTITDTHDYHDSGAGLELAGSSIAITGVSSSTSRSWGTRNGQLFDDTSVSLESVNRSTTFAGEAGVVQIADGLENAFPLRGMVNSGNVFIQSAPVHLANNVFGRGPQTWYNYRVKEIGEAGEKKVANLDVKQGVLWAINDTPNGTFPSGSGTFTYDNSGWTFAIGLGRGGDIKADDRKWKKLFKTQGYGTPTLVSTSVEIVYVVDQATQNPRSGNVVATYRTIFKYSVPNKTGIVLNIEKDSIVGNVIIHDAKLEKMKLQESN